MDKIKQMVGDVKKTYGDIRNKYITEQKQYDQYKSDKKSANRGVVSPLPMTPNPYAKQVLPAKVMAKAPAPIPSRPVVTATPTPIPAPSRYADLIKRGFEHYGNPPAATLSGIMAQEIEKYPILQQHPELLPIITILESGGMKKGAMPPVAIPSHFPGSISNENRQFNGFGWGLDPRFEFNPDSPEAVVRKVASGIATKPQYAPFRKSGKIEDLAEVYSPYHPVNNPEGGKRYVKNYNSIASWFK